MSESQRKQAQSVAQLKRSRCKRCFPSPTTAAQTLSASSHTLQRPSNARFAIVAAQFNDIVTERLVNGCISGLAARGADTAEMPVCPVFGSFFVLRAFV